MEFTKERLLKIQSWSETYGPGSNVMLPAEEAEELARIALASREAEPVAWKVEHKIFRIRFIAETYAGETGAAIEPLYATPPVPIDNTFIPKNLDRALGVVGVALPESKEEFNFQIERWIQRLIDRVIRYSDEFKEQPAPVVPEDISNAIETLKKTLVSCHRYNYCSDAVKRLEDACRAAMLQGKAEPVSQPYKLPPNSFTNDDLEMMAHGDNPQANAYRELLAFRRNNPVIPDGWQLVPVDPTLEMIKSGANAASTGMLIPGMYRAMLAAAPQQESK